MGLIAQTVESLREVRNIASFAPLGVSPWQSGRAQFPDGKYQTFAREGYSKNELVFAAIEELATSAAEPTLKVKIGEEWTHQAPIIQFLERPNPFHDRFEFWATVIMHRSIAGNAYGLIVRSASGRPVQIWLMRPDRIRIVPDSAKYISHYEYDIGGGEPVKLPIEDVVHWKTRNPVDDFYGMPPLMAASGRVDIDNYMKDFVKTFFQSAGVPAGLLSVKGRLEKAAKKEIKERFRHDYGGPSGWHDLMVLDQDASFTPMTANMGTSGLVVPDLDEINEARILMCFGVPPELVGARVGMRNSSYAQKDAARESFWDETLAPLYKELAGPLNLRVVPAFYGERANPPLIAFDLSDVRALQEDEDQIHDRVLKDVAGTVLTVEEGRAKLGYGDMPADGTLLVSANVGAITVADLKAGRANEALNPPKTAAEVPA